jgi:cobalt-zinc-cadmium efflux system outer membrane protein
MLSMVLEQRHRPTNQPPVDFQVLARLTCLAAALYLLLPFDFICDFAPNGIGYVDDAVVLLLQLFSTFFLLPKQFFYFTQAMLGLAFVVLLGMLVPAGAAAKVNQSPQHIATSATVAKQGTGGIAEMPQLAPINLSQDPLLYPLNSTPEKARSNNNSGRSGNSQLAAASPLNLNIAPTNGTDAAAPSASTPAPPKPRGEKIEDLPIGGQENMPANPVLSGYLSVNDVLNEALMRSPRAAAQRALLRIQMGLYPAATMAPDPVLYRDEAAQSEQVLRMGSQNTWDPPWKLAFRLLAARRQVREQKLEILNALWAFRNQVRGAYLELVMAQESLDTLSTLADLSNRLASISRRMYTAGSVAGLDVLKAELAAHQAEIDRNQGRRRVTLAQQQLNLIMGRSRDTSLMVARLPEFPEKAEKTGLMPNFGNPVPSIDDFMEIALSNRLELRILKAQIEVASAQLKNSWMSIIPDQTMAMGYSANNNGPSGPKIKGIWDTGTWEYPMFTYGQADIPRLKWTIRQYQQQILAQRNQIACDVSSAYNHLITARERIATYQDHVLAESERVAQLARRSYEVGQSDITSTLAAQQANVQVKQNYLDAVNSYQQAFTELEQAVGLPLI